MWTLNWITILAVYLSVNSNGVVGSYDEKQEECAACLKTTCRSISGLYTQPELPPGYSLISQIPKGACRILIQQLKHTRNYLAIRDSNGTYILNGNWKFSNSGTYSGAGTKFTYVKQDGSSLETITSPGPLSNPIDMMIVNYQANPGVKYGYHLPFDEPSVPNIAPPLLKRPAPNIGAVEPRRLDPPPNNSLNQRDEARPPLHRRTRVRRKFAWKITGLSACSKSCGGGIQTAVLSCVREYTKVPVLERRCAHLERPVTQPIKCNTQDCPPHWKGQWSTCSVTCGDGVEQLVYHCQQELAGRTVNVNDNACPKPRPITQNRACNPGLCENIIDNVVPLTPSSHVKDRKDWTVGPWSSCSVSCGTGHRTRSVTCPSGQCLAEDRPKHAEYCDTGPCTTSPTSETSPWLFTEWSHCSSACGTGSQTRLSVCSKDKCDPEAKPETSRACSSDKQCGGQWFTGPWGPCSDSCSGPAKQKREVHCVVKIRGHSRITNEMTCPAFLKPNEEQSCSGQCPPKWFISEWGNCECPSEIQRRTVKCMDAQGRPSNSCADVDMPVAKRQCPCQRREEHKEKTKPAQDEPSDSSCIDKIRNCYLAVQARLCQYPYYTNHCCVSCRRAQHDL